MSSLPAQQELERRHFPAVRAFAAFSAVHAPAAGELAYQAWEAALRQQVDGGGCIRSGALAAVLRTASDWARGHGRVALLPQLAAWIDATSPAMPGYAPAGVLPSSLAARAYAGLACRSQTILWHYLVERDHDALTAQLIGAAPGEVPLVIERALGELYSSYIQVLWDGMQDECRRYHRLVLAYADNRSPNIAAEVSPHLERCARCSQAVSDLGRIRQDSAGLLAQALLPWGGMEYASRPRNEGGPLELMPGTGLPAAAPVNELPAGSMAPEPMAPASMESASHGTRSRPTGRGRHAVPAAKGPGRGVRTKGSRRRVELVVRCTAVAGVCAVGAGLAFGFVGGSSTGDPQSKLPVEAAEAASPPPSTKSAKPSDKTAIAKSTTQPKPKRAAPKPDKNKPEKPDAPSRPRPAEPAVGNAAVQWLFNKSDDSSVTTDSSGNGKNGSLFGASRPQPVNGALPLDGSQFVASDGPVVDTSRSFTVSARVKLNRTDVSQTVLSQDSSASSAFMLQYDANDGQWEMRMPKADTGDAESDADEAGTTAGVAVGEVVHLTGVYDDAADKISLYVNGRLADTAEHTEDFASAERFIVGRGLSGNEFFQGLEGTVDDVKAFGKAVSSAQAKKLAE
jgi:hypothetical protein